MIQASELRIGNHVLHHNERWEINAIDGSCDQVDLYNNDHRSDVDCDFLEPIPLSPSILEACGFVELNGGYLSPLFKAGRILIKDNKWFNGCWNTDIKYLHRLQNLWHSLTETELPIDTTKL